MYLILETGGTVTNASLNDSCNATLHYCFAIQLYNVNTLPKSDRGTLVTLYCVCALSMLEKLSSRLTFNLHFASTVFHGV